jgi:Protein of unknown function (DUF2009)
MITHLKEHFHPTQPKDPKSNLAIRIGKGGARLSHDHSKQYAYVLQSLSLWKEILHGMYRVAHRFYINLENKQICFICGHWRNKICFLIKLHIDSVTQDKALTVSKRHQRHPA